jgi:hypothetical protein
MLVSVDLFNAIAVRVRLGQKGYYAVLDRGLGMLWRGHFEADDAFVR